MPIQKFRNFDDTRRALWVPTAQQNLIARIRGLWTFSLRLVPRQIPRGVRKFRSIEAANQEREQWVMQHIQDLRTQRALRKQDVHADDKSTTVDPAWSGYRYGK